MDGNAQMNGHELDGGFWIQYTESTYSYCPISGGRTFASSSQHFDEVAHIGKLQLLCSWQNIENSSHKLDNYWSVDICGRRNEAIMPLRR